LAYKGSLWQYWHQSRGGQREFKGHIASDTLGKTLATDPPREGAIFLLGARPPVPPPVAPALVCGIVYPII